MTAPSGPFSRSRVRIHFTAPVTLYTPEEDRAYDGCCDLSMNGLFIRTARPMALGTRARFTIHLAAGMRHQSIEGECEVVRVEPVDDGLSGENPGPGMGLKFLDLEEGHAEILYQLIRQNSG